MTKKDPYPDHEDLAEDPGPHSAGAGAPGASGPGEPGYRGRATVGDDPGIAGAEATPEDTTEAEDIAMARIADRAIKDNLVD